MVCFLLVYPIDKSYLSLSIPEKMVEINNVMTLTPAPNGDSPSPLLPLFSEGEDKGRGWA